MYKEVLNMSPFYIIQRQFARE